MIEGLDRLDRWMQQAIASLSPSRRKKLLNEIGKDLRKGNQKRITVQEDPEGKRWLPRQKRNGQISGKKKMMLGLRKARRMHLKSSPEGTEVGYTGLTSQIASVHQFGGMDQVTPDGPKVRYPVRAMLGISNEDQTEIRDKMIGYMFNIFR